MEYTPTLLVFATELRRRGYHRAADYVVKTRLYDSEDVQLEDGRMVTTNKGNTFIYTMFYPNGGAAVKFNAIKNPEGWDILALG
ncbi:hypothetical protein D6833_06665 [Candidatus Parcubacteria bacterium]|nr:MAG: hypothetical protein D6833_06665 [Candidatus Parcubacteria bacterium]